MCFTAGLILLHIRSGVLARRLPSLADVFIHTSVYWFFGIEIILITIFLLFLLIKNDFKSNVIVKQKSKKLIWLKQIYKNILFSIFTTSWITICTYVLGGLMTKYFINWGSEKSIFFARNGIVCNSIKISHVIFLFFISSFIRILLISTISILVYWVTNKKIISWILVITLGFAEISISIIYKIVSIDYTVWTSQIRIILGFLYGIILILISVRLGILAGKRKEFYNE